MKFDNLRKVDNYLYELPRGGYLLDSPDGYIQFGSPPETIKDTMNLPGGVPEVFILPENMFNWSKGISIAEIEFPIYYNFFLCKKKTLIICRKEQFSKMKFVLEESIFGPDSFDITKDYSLSTNRDQIPDIKSEIIYFKNNNTIDNMIQFEFFSNNYYSFKGIHIHLNSDASYTVSINDDLISVPANIEYKTIYHISERLIEPYLPPLFGITCLGPSHGFDPEENTSGFIIWLNHQGIMVDPPVNSTEWLEASNVSPKFIDSIILTHCHADHDAGTFQKILEEGKVTVYTTKTIMDSFLNKYSRLSDVSIEFLLHLFDFYPVTIGDPLYINGGKFDLFYTLHSIPTIGFKMEFQNQTFVYTSDHNNDPNLHKLLFKNKIISKNRYKELTNFPWDSKVIYHESGFPPLHTPINYLNSLPDDVKKRIVIYHIAKKDFPENSLLKLAQFGMENTLYFDTQSPKFEEAHQVLSIFKRLDFMSDMPVFKAQELLDIINIKKYNKGENIIQKDTIGNEFYIIYSGNISVDTGGLEQNKIYGPYDYFGEVALITGHKRGADVFAETDVILFTIQKDKFLNFIVGTEFEKILRRVAAIRSSETWNLFTINSFLNQCTSTQKTWLESIFIPIEIHNETILINENQKFESLYLIRGGEVKVLKNNTIFKILNRGAFVGSLKNLYNGSPSNFTYKIFQPVSLFSMNVRDLKIFFKKNPGLIMKFIDNEL